MTSFEQFIQKPASEKVVLAWIEPSYRLQGWVATSGGVYRVKSPEFVVALAEEGVALTEVFANPANPGEWYFDRTAGTVYIYPYSGDPNVDRIRADFRMFFSTGPFIAPYSLNIGETEVDYQPLILNTSQFGYEFDSEQLGIMLEGQGAISLQNTHGYFDQIWEKYFWENKPCSIFSWSPEIEISEAKIIYRGYIKGKSFSSSAVTFSLTDFIYKLQNPIPLTQYSDSDGIIPESSVGKFKRRIYGRIDGLRGLSLDQTLDGFALTGTVRGDTGSKNLIGTGTQFLAELSPEDDIIFEDSRYKIEEILSNTSATVSRALEEGISGTVYVVPEVPYRRKNRTWHIAGHPLKKIKATIQSIISGNRYVVDTIENLFAGDTVVIGTKQVVIRRISGNTIVFNSNISPLPSIGDYFYRYPVQGVNVGTRDFVLFRDYELINTPEAKIEFDELAEFNTTEEFPFVGTASFVNGSRTITGVGTSFDTDFKTRDWIRKTGSTVFYEILSVDAPDSMTIRTPFTETTGVYSGFKKNVTYLDDESLVTVNCYGKSDDNTEDGNWIKTTPDVVKDLLTEQGLGSLLDTDSFEEANKNAPEVVSLKLPTRFGDDESITVSDGINLMSTTSLGALYSNQDFNIAYSVVNAKKPPELVELTDDDILGFEVINRADEISREIVGMYRHLDADRYTGKESTSTKTVVNEVVDLFMDTKKSKSIDLYLYNESEVTTLVRRYGLLYESGSTRIVVTTKLNLSRKNIGDKLYLNFDRLYKRFGSDGSRRKISMITGVKKDGFNTIVTIDDFGNIFTKVATFADPSSQVFTDASDDQRARNGYFVFDDTELSDENLTYRLNLFG